jgi:hypothetical protein
VVQSLEVQGHKASTLAAYETTTRAHLAPYFGDRPVHQITTEDVEGFIASCTAKGCAPKSIRNYVGALHAINQMSVGFLMSVAGSTDRQLDPNDVAVLDAAD